MYQVLIRDSHRLANVPEIVNLGVLRPLDPLIFEQTAYSSSPRDRWDKEIFRLQSG